MLCLLFLGLEEEEVVVVEGDFVVILEEEEEEEFYFILFKGVVLFDYEDIVWIKVYLFLELVDLRFC